ncbi:uracil permease [Caproiciproducens galactitolivorans]|uniref:Uracil permease n=1 Tax=Caproiciproducens galactitolivorans TaxID=642589 RepID=A0ABT4BQZ2_9FIRM|nr:uracil permease [Caproiciproducens galactitolivorans]MCY1713298.1 uracil permease [Caproiciproducens galactitolivorans]
MQREIIQVEEKVPILKSIPLSLQHMFAMFGASVIVPLTFHMNPAIVLLMNGIGTLIFILITKGKAPAYLGSSFAFIAPVLLIIGNKSMNYQYALGGFIAAGAVFCIVALIIRFFGIKWIDVVLPPAAMGAVVALIGLELAGTAAQSGGIVVSDTYKSIDPKFVAVFLVTLLVAVFGSVLFRKFFAVIPLLIAIVTGYVLACILHLVDFTPVQQAPWFAIPNFSAPIFDWDAIRIILPASLVVISEHIGHQLVTSKIVGRDLVKDPGLHRTLLADGISTMLSGFCGSVPTTTYGENIGVMAITRVYSVQVIGGAAILSIIIAFIGKLTALIQTIPGPVIGGVSFLLYGMIAASGIRLLVEAKVDYSRSRNLALTSVVFITGLSGVSVPLGSVPLRGMALATIVGMILSLLFYLIDYFHLANDYE